MKLSKKDLLSEIAKLKREKAEMDLLIETNIEHSDSVIEDLFKKLNSAKKALSLRISTLQEEVSHLRQELSQLKREKTDLELLVEMNIEHSDYITEDLLNKVETTLRESEKRFRLISETIPVPIIVSRVPDNLIVYANRPASDLIGLPVEVLFQSKITDFYNSGEQQLLSDILDAHGKVSNYELQGKKTDGTQFWAALFVRPLRFKEELCRLTVWYDMSDRKQAEEERKRLATAVEQVAESIIITDKKGNIEYINPAFEQTIGYSREEIIGFNFGIFKNDKHEAAFYKKMWQTISDGEVWTGHVINIKKDNSLCEFETTISPIRDISGSIINFVSVNRDVTHEVQMEKQLRQAQKMEAIGTLAAGISHDFNNILSAIIGYTELAQINLPPQSSVQSKLDKVLRAADRAKELVMQILTFCRMAEHEKKPLQLRPVVKEAIRLLRALIPSTIEIQQILKTEAGTVLADPTQIHQIIMNLCTNAANAMREKGGILEVILEDVEIDKKSVTQHPDLKIGLYVKISVRDTGHGIPREVMDRMFDPFFTTKKPGEGTGMGLAVVHGIVRSHNGAIIVESELGEGSTFHIYFPRSDAMKKMPEIGNDEMMIPVGNERILFIDDEPDLAEIFKEMLEHLGYEVITCTNSLKALKIFYAKPDKFDLIITDQTMPQMTGEALAKEFMRIRPDIPIILCTGYSEQINKEKAMEMGIKGFMMKPFDNQEIAVYIRKIFDKK